MISIVRSRNAFSIAEEGSIVGIDKQCQRWTPAERAQAKAIVNWFFGPNNGARPEMDGIKETIVLGIIRENLGLIENPLLSSKAKEIATEATCKIQANS
ncbi:hypothetical protein KA025_02210 [Candidatus Saccharibacteria bacterium]|nr:hypothetical protein [Candidatus Saccharibacteria bacterium]